MFVEIACNLLQPRLVGSRVEYVVARVCALADKEGVAMDGDGGGS